MKTLFLVVVMIGLLLALVRTRPSAVMVLGALIIGSFVCFILKSPVLGVVIGLGAIALAATGLPGVRSRWLTPKVFDIFKKISPKVSQTEQIALDAGTVGWDGDLFSGQPLWKNLTGHTNPGLTQDEQAFLDGPCEYAVNLCNGWDVAMNRADIPQQAWDFIKKERFLGMIIPKEYGGLGFSAKAQSAVLQKLSSSDVLMISVGVPNSLGPGELLLKYGTQKQKDHYLPRLADGRDVPCFGLTGPRAGSDATSIPDTGIVCKGQFDGKEVIGLKLNFEKRWITLAPIATVVGLAFRMFDPEHLLGGEEDIGITCALIPRDTAGMEIGRRHYPIGSPFFNGPIRGTDVFIPLEYLIGGAEMAGQGWRMLVECLSVGRCITLPSAAAGLGATFAGWSGGFTRIRRQFGVPVAEMEGVQVPLARMAAMAYISKASVYQTADMIDRGEKPAVPSAILKSHLTEFQRQMAIDAMDVHGGKAVTLGPNNYLGLLYSGSAVSITVEGANIMTRNLMIFGQGAIRCHAYVLDELKARDTDNIAAFDKAFFGHVGLVMANVSRSFLAACGLVNGSTPIDGKGEVYANAVNRFSAVLSLLADVAMASLGSKLKQREMISARLGDLLSNLYLTSMVLKHWHEGSKSEGETQLMEYSCQFLLHRYEIALVGVLRHLPFQPAIQVLRFVVMPFGQKWHLPGDDLVRQIAKAISTDSIMRSDLLKNVSNQQREDKGSVHNALAEYNGLLKDYERAEGIYRILRKAQAKKKIPMTALHPEQALDEAHKAQLVSVEDYEFMVGFEARVLRMISVDDFAIDAIVFSEQEGPATADSSRNCA